MHKFDDYHPIILFFYFVLVIFITMFSMHPIVLGLSFLCSVIFCLTLEGGKKLFLSLCYTLPMMLILALSNPLFVHKGVTTLFYLFDNPVTLEALLYGVNIALMLGAVFYWFKCYNKVMTTDKFVYLFGKSLPKISLLLSMTLRFIPQFKRRFSEIASAQKAMGMFSGKGLATRIRARFRVLSILITWSLENSINTADSMRARGYGLKNRTTYSVFKWGAADTLLSIFVVGLGLFIMTILFLGKMEFFFYPAIAPIDTSINAIIFYISVLLIMVINIILQVGDKAQWNFYKSKT